MSDYYTEQLVKKKTTLKDMLMIALLGVLTVFSILVVFLFPFGIIIPCIMIAVDVFLFRKLDVEYEYLFVNGDLDIDKIMHKAKRKRVFSVNVHDVELLAPAGSPELKQHSQAKICDYSSMQAGAKIYVLVAILQGQKKQILFEPNETIVEGFRMLAPRKVIL